MASALSDPALPLIGNSPWKFSRNSLTAVALALVLGLAGCGGDDEDEPSQSTVATAPTETAPTAPTTTEEDEPEPKTETTPAESPEEEPGGAGDEEPARTLALFTAENGRITPRVVRVPAFISIQVELRSKDGREYGLRFGDVGIRAGAELNSVSTTIDGLRPGEAIVGRPIGADNGVRIEATAEPGP
jgi:hypothetical protein